jgi:hypothetical protein
MKSLKRILLLVVILALGILAPGAQLVRAQSSQPALLTTSVNLSPGEYIGTFQFDVREMFVNSTPGLLTVNINDNRDVDVSGTMLVVVTGPTTGTITIAPSRYNIYEIRDISATGSGVNCKMMGYINGDAEIFFIAPLMNDYDSQTESFISDISITGWSIQDFRNTVISNHPACTQQVNKEGLTSLIQNFFDGINKNSPLHFYVGSNGETSLAGSVLLKSYEKSLNMPGGWWERTTSGSWHADKEPVKPKGWKQ